MIRETPMLAGALIGLSVTAPIGPMGVLCIQRTLVSGMACGVSTGLGATVMQLCYVTMFLLGLRELGPELALGMQAFNIGGGLLLLWFGLRLLRRRVQLRTWRQARPASLLLASTSAMALNACNPMLLLLVTGAVTSIAGVDPPKGYGMVLLLLGIALGSAGWWIALTSVVAAFRNQLHPRMLDALNCISAASLLGFGALAVSRTVWF